MTPPPLRPPYEGLRVLDLSQGIAGPSCANILGQGGAAVVKIEPPSGDWARLMGTSRDGETALSLACNFGKRSVCIDATKPAGRDVVLRLARDADVVIESFRPGVVDRLGLGWPAMQAINPRLVYASITGFGATGPDAAKPGSDSVLQALTGMMVMNRDDAGQPRRVGMLLVDAASAVYAAQAVGAALFARARDGVGRHVEISLLQSMAALQSIPIMDEAIHAGAPRPPVSVPAGSFATADGMINLVALRSAMFHGVCRAIGRPDWLADPRFATNEGRLAHRAEINAGIAAVLATASSAHWIRRFEAEDVLCAPVRDYDGFRADPQVRHGGLFGALEPTPFGTVPVGLLPGGTGTGTLSGAPRLGADTRAVLAEHGYGAEAIERLLADGVIRQPGEGP